jgi:cytochrome c oxidase subunit 2
MALFISIYLFTMMVYATEAVSASSSFILSSHASYNLHMALFYLCSGIAGIVFIVLIYSLVKHRQSKGKKAVHFHTYLGLELIWTTIPFLILVALAIPAIINLMHYHG